MFQITRKNNNSSIEVISNVIVLKSTINSKINGTPKGVYLPISKLHSILAIANLLAHNKLWLCYYEQVNSLMQKSNVAFKWANKNL